MPVITRAGLRRFAPRAAPRIIAAFEAHGDAAFARWKITTPARLRMFMAQVKVESADLSVLIEDVTYTAARIHAVWPSRFPTIAAAQRYAHAPEALADKVYDGRMGNRPGTHDGWLNRGQGLLDNTGLTNLNALAAHMGLTTDDVRARLTSDDGMVDCAAATFHMLGCLPFADRGDLIGCSKRINGGLLGLTDRRLALALASRVWPAMPPIRAVVAARRSTDQSAPPIHAAAAKSALRAPAGDPAPTSWLDQALSFFTPAA